MESNSSSTDSTGRRAVVVAMSGGVDSSVAALLLSKTDDTLVGVSMQVWDYKQASGENGKASCCSPADFCDARRVAAKLGIPYYVVDFEETFRREVIDRFVETYHQGLTPNPCIDCNSRVKFRSLRERAATFGCSYVATGHYARIKESPSGFHLLRGKDLDKDQSYFLYTCRQDELGKTLFPVGEFTKPEIRELAREAGLATAEKAESQDICFVSGTAHEFVTKIGGRKPRGAFVTKSGAVVGEHDGIHRYTVGQRRGLQLGGAPEPLYVVGIDPAENRVIVGPREELEREGFSVGEMHFVNPDLLESVRSFTSPFERRVTVQVRSRHRGVPAIMRIESPERARLSWLSEWAPVSPGQAAVMYDEENVEVLAGGRILPEM